MVGQCEMVSTGWRGKKKRECYGGGKGQGAKNFLTRRKEGQKKETPTGGVGKLEDSSGLGNRGIARGRKGRKRSLVIMTRGGRKKAYGSAVVPEKEAKSFESRHRGKGRDEKGENSRTLRIKKTRDRGSERTKGNKSSAGDRRKVGSRKQRGGRTTGAITGKRTQGNRFS